MIAIALCLVALSQDDGWPTADELETKYLKVEAAWMPIELGMSEGDKKKTKALQSGKLKPHPIFVEHEISRRERLLAGFPGPLEIEKIVDSKNCIAIRVFTNNSGRLVKTPYWIARADTEKLTQGRTVDFGKPFVAVGTKEYDGETMTVLIQVR